MFRRTTATGQIAWLDGSYPEILGLIGYSYLAVAILYIPTRRWVWASALWFVLLLALCAFSTAGWIQFFGRLPLYVWPFGNGAMGCIIMAGAVTSSIYFSPSRRRTLQQSIYLAAGFCLLTFAVGWLLTPLGISKIRATPTWSLYCIGAAVLLFMSLYWICDVKQWQRWAFLFRRPPGLEYSADLSAARFLVFRAKRGGVHLVRRTLPCRRDRSGKDACVHSYWGPRARSHVPGSVFNSDAEFDEWPRGSIQLTDSLNVGSFHSIEVCFRTGMVC